MIKKLQIRGDVAIDIHRHEARQLQKARIDIPSRPRIAKGHGADAIARKPCAATLPRQKIDLGRASPRVDRTAHQRHRSRNVRAVPRLHEGNSRDQRNRRLADPDRMHDLAVMLLAQGFADRDHVVDVIVKIEPPARKRNRPGIEPVGDVDVIEGEKRFHRAAQQGRVMARHGRDDQQLLLRRPGGAAVKLLFKTEKLAKRP